MITNIVERAVTEVTVQASLTQHALRANCAVRALCEVSNVLCNPKLRTIRMRSKVTHPTAQTSLSVMQLMNITALLMLRVSIRIRICASRALSGFSHPTPNSLYRLSCPKGIARRLDARRWIHLP